MASITADDINNLEELMDALDLLDELDLDAEGVDDVPEAQRRLREYLVKQQQSSGREEMVRQYGVMNALWFSQTLNVQLLWIFSNQGQILHAHVESLAQ